VQAPAGGQASPASPAWQGAAMQGGGRQEGGGEGGGEAEAARVRQQQVQAPPRPFPDRHRHSTSEPITSTLTLTVTVTLAVRAPVRMRDGCCGVRLLQRQGGGTRSAQQLGVAPAQEPCPSPLHDPSTAPPSFSACLPPSRAPLQCVACRWRRCRSSLAAAPATVTVGVAGGQDPGSHDGGQGTSPLRGMGGVQVGELEGEGGQCGWWAEVARSSGLGFGV